MIRVSSCRNVRARPSVRPASGAHGRGLLELAGKRGLGFINWQRGRKYIHRREALDAITRDLKAHRRRPHRRHRRSRQFVAAGRIRARRARWLENSARRATSPSIPGNHDAYVPQALGGPAEYWGDYMRGDDGAEAGTFPFVRRRGPLALIALSSAVPTGPFMATGELGDQQLSRLAQALDANKRHVPRRAHSSPAGQSAQPLFAAADRRRGISPGPCRARRRPRSSRP